MFYGATVWDPWLIITQIITVQCLFYLSFGLLLYILLGGLQPLFAAPQERVVTSCCCATKSAEVDMSPCCYPCRALCDTPVTAAFLRRLEHGLPHL